MPKLQLNAEILQRYFALEAHPFLKLVLNLPGFRDRLLADDKFMAKLGFEVFIGVCTKIAAELERRRENFNREVRRRRRKKKRFPVPFQGPFFLNVEHED